MARVLIGDLAWGRGRGRVRVRVRGRDCVVRYCTRRSYPYPTPGAQSRRKLLYSAMPMTKPIAVSTWVGLRVRVAVLGLRVRLR